jgi:hypothetical protein
LAALFAFTKVGNAVTFPEGSMMGYYDDLKKMADSISMSPAVLKNTMDFSDSVVAAIMRWSKKIIMRKQEQQKDIPCCIMLLAVGYQHPLCMEQLLNPIGVR